MSAEQLIDSVRPFHLDIFPSIDPHGWVDGRTDGWLDGLQTAGSEGGKKPTVLKSVGSWEGWLLT